MAKRLNVMVITQIPLWSIDRRSGGPAISQMIFGYAQAGHTVHLVTPRLSYVSQADLPGGVTLHTFKHTFHGVLIHRKKIGWIFDMAGWVVFQIKARRIGARLLRAGNFDLVYGYEVWGVPCARKLADRFRLPMVSRFQGTWMKKWMHARLRNVRFYKHLRAFRTPADLYIMTDDGTFGDRMLAECGVDMSKVRFWRNGIEERFCDTGGDSGAAKTGFGVDSSDRMLLTTSRLVRMKGVQHAIRAMPRILDRFPGTKLVVVGDGPYRPELESLAHELGVADSVTFTGGLDRDRVAQAMTGADVFLSLYDESNVGNPLLEAMSCGKAVVTRDVGGTGTVVTDGVNGVLLDADSTDEVAGVVCELLGDEVKRRTLGLAAHDWARTNLQTWQERMDMEIEEVTKLVEGWNRIG